MTVLSVPRFGGGVVLEGSPDVEHTDELSACEGYDIGARGQLVAASDLSTFAQTTGGGTDPGLAPIYGMLAVGVSIKPILLFIGKGTDGGVGTSIRYGTLFPDGSIDAGGIPGGVPGDPGNGPIVTFASFPYIVSGAQRRLVLVSIGARAGLAPNSGFGLYAMLYNQGAGSYTFLPISDYDALGTGSQGEFPGGTKSRMMAPRGIVGYNNHAFAWGWDSKDSGGDGPTRLMFSNIGNPLKWGRDPDEQGIADGTTPESDRQFEDSDAIDFGGGCESIRCGYVYAGKLWIGTNRGLQFLEGFGRESFRTNGPLPLASSRNCVGPKAMIEGPDRLLYGVSDEGLWRTNGGEIEPVGDKLRDFAGFSPGWWDLIWSDPSRGEFDYPGRTNQDLLWMESHPLLKQVWIVIPHCDIASGAGPGSDSVIIKYHVMTGGFTRQLFPGRILTAGSFMKREGNAAAQLYVCDSADPDHNVLRYGYKATPASSPALPSTLPTVETAEYAPFGPNGAGVLKRRYLTLAWEWGALPLAFTLTPTIDGQAQTAVRLTIAPAAPATPSDGDVWVDTSGTDPNLGNVGSGTIVSANAADYITRAWNASWNKWVHVPGGGQQGNRVTVPIAFKPVRGTRLKVAIDCALASGRYQLEQFAERPDFVAEAS